MITAEKKPADKRPPFIPNVRVGTALDAGEFGAWAARHPETFLAHVDEKIASGDLSFARIRSLPKLWHALRDVRVPVQVEELGEMRALEASAFPLLVGGLTLAGINAGYDSLAPIGGQLVTEMEDNKRLSVFAAIHALTGDRGREVAEGKDYPEISATEDWVTIGNKRQGYLLRITAETMEENNVADIARRVNTLGEIAGEDVEEQTIRRVCDIDGSATSPAEPYVYHPKGAGASLYSASANTPSTQTPLGTRIHNNALADATNLEAARARLASFKNKGGKRIAIPMSQCQLVVPDALVGLAGQIRGSEMSPDVANELNQWGPRGMWQPQLVSSPKLDDLSTTAWYLGNFRRQFTRKWKLRFEYVTLGQDTESFLRSRIAAQFRIGWDCEIGATDHVYVVQSISATTAP